MTAPMDTIRLDKWLWCARFYKTRGLASTAIKGGKISVNSIKAKPAKQVHVGDQLVIRNKTLEHHIEILGITSHRGSATIAQELYEESEASIESRRLRRAEMQVLSAMTPYAKGKPSKRDRRDIERFTKRNS